MNETLKTIHELRSIRNFSDKEITDLDLKTILDAAVRAATAGMQQSYSIVVVEDEIVLEIPTGTQSGHVFRLKGKGIKRLNGGGKGDQLVKVYVEVPKSLNAHQKKLLREFEASLGKKAKGTTESFTDKVKKMFK